MSTTMARALPAAGLPGGRALLAPALAGLAGAVVVGLALAVTGGGPEGSSWAILAGGLACASGLVLGSGRSPRAAAVLAAAAAGALAIAVFGTAVRDGGESPAVTPHGEPAPAAGGTAVGGEELAVPPRGGPATTPGPHEAGTGPAAGTVRRFYAALDGGRFAQAWARLSPDVQAAFGGFEAWREGYATTLGHEVRELRVEPDAGGATVRHVLIAEDRTPCGGRVQRSFAVRWRLDAGTGKATSLSAVKRAGREPAQACT